ncbi:MAG: hypothetical protein WA118_12280 [Carboxydocellales bacterium]
MGGGTLEWELSPSKHSRYPGRASSWLSSLLLALRDVADLTLELWSRGKGTPALSRPGLDPELMLGPMLTLI